MNYWVSRVDPKGPVNQASNSKSWDRDWGSEVRDDGCIWLILKNSVDYFPSPKPVTKSVTKPDIKL